MNHKRMMFFLSVSVILFIVTVLISWNSPISRNISSGEKTEIAIINSENSFIVRYESFKKILTILKPDKKIKLKGTNFQKAYNIMEAISKDNIREKMIYFIDISSSGIYTQNLFSNYLINWRKKPFLLINFMWKILEIKKNEMTNFSYFELISIWMELLHTKISDFIIEEVNIKQQEDEYENIAENSNNNDVKIEILNASSKKNMAFKIARILQAKRINVLNISTKNKQDKSEIISTNENIEKAQIIKEILNLKDAQIYIKKSRYRIYDVTLIIGEDFEENKISNK